MNRKAKQVAEEQLREIVRRHHTILHDDKDLIEFAPGDVAERVYDELDPKMVAPILVQSAAYFELSTLADNIRKKKRKPVPDQIEMFEGLFDRYTVKRHGQHLEVLRTELTFEERREISRKLHARLQADKEHVEAFDRETAELLKRGLLRKGKRTA